jgi:hypothetical protein
MAPKAVASHGVPSIDLASMNHLQHICNSASVADWFDFCQSLDLIALVLVLNPMVVWDVCAGSEISR